MKILLTLISFILLIDLNVIHEDKILKIDKNGNIVGLPKKFMPAQFDLNKNTLRIHDKEIVFPKCVSYYFKEQKNPNLILSGSWYHSKVSLPYYLNFQITDKSVRHGHTILVNLETLDLIYIQKLYNEGSSSYDSEISVGQDCLAEYKKAIRSVN